MKPGDTFGDYAVERLLGKGGMGEVWLLRDDEGREVAAKFLDAAASQDHEARKRFLREAELAMGVKHPNLVEVYDIGQDPGTGLCYILMEYVPGGSLADYLKTNGALPIEDAVAVVQAIAGVLELGRTKGIGHRDIKPANIMFGADGTPKLADLGIARGGLAGEGGTETTTVTQTGTMIGTPAYMSPEQMLDAHHVDTRADIYSLGVVFFEMLTGERPNKDDTVIELMAKAVKGEPLPDVRTLRPEVSASLAQLINMMVVPDKDGRISTPGQITSALATIARGGELNVKTPAAVPNPAPRRAFPWKALLPWIGGALALVAVALAAAALALCLRRPADRDPVERVVVRTNLVERVETSRIGDLTWYYTLRQGAAVLCYPGVRPDPTGLVKIPSRLDGYPVVEIGNEAFRSNSLEGVQTSRTVRKIGRKAFADCRNLREVRTAEGELEEVGSYVFADDVALEWVVFPTTVKRLGSGVFHHCSGLKSIGFMGNAPEIDTGKSNPLGDGIPESCAIHVEEGTTGWKTEGSAEFPERWPRVDDPTWSRPLRAARRRTDFPEATVRTQRALDARFPGWEVSAIEPLQIYWASGLQTTWRGRRDVVTTSPPTADKPCLLSREMTLPSRNPVLVMEVASKAQDADFLLTVRVNGQVALKTTVVRTLDDRPYSQILVPLAKWAGKSVKIEIEHSSNNWYFEHAFWSRLEVIEGTGHEKAGPVGFVLTPVFPPVSLKNKSWQRRSPWAYTTKAPSVEWMNPAFDDSGWQRTTKALGCDVGEELMPVTEEWRSPRLWLRRTFDWQGSLDVNAAIFLLRWDQDAEFYLNGVKIMDCGGWWTGDWKPILAWPVQFKEALKKGRNTLAVTVKGDGASFFDCGLVIETREGKAQGKEAAQ